MNFIIYLIYLKKEYLYLYPIIYKLSKDTIELFGGSGCIHSHSERVGEGLRLGQVLLLELFGYILQDLLAHLLLPGVVVAKYSILEVASAHLLYKHVE